MPTTHPRVRTLAGAVALLLVTGLAAAVQVSTAPAAGAAAASGVTVERLTTNGRTDPLGIPGKAPSFGWASSSSERGVVQSAYQVRVATSEDALAGADVWDSGKVESDRQVDVVYKGPALDSKTRYLWQVRVWDGAGESSAWSEPESFETGMLGTDDWGDAEWIGAAPGTEVERWTDYTATFDFSIDNLVFAAFVRSESVADGYMWQLSVADGTPRFRPHRKVGGSYSLVDNIDISSVISADDLASGSHTMTVTVEGDTITTELDGTEIDQRTDSTHARGYVGFRTSQATEGSEAFTVHDVTVEAASGESLLDVDFSAGNPFTGGELVDGGLAVEGNQEVLWRSPDDNLPLLRTDFATEAGKSVTRARVYATARGVYEMNINGEKVGDQHLAPGFTDYQDRIQHQTYDVTDLVEDGANALGAEMGRGWWAGKVGMWGPGVYGNNLSLLARLRIDYADGSTQWVDSGDGWTSHSGPYVAADNIDGETYDARLAQPGWDQPGYDDGDWGTVVTRSSVTDRVVPQPDEPVRTTEELDTVERTEPTPDTFVYDLGQNMVGVARMVLSGQAGSTVKIRYGEELNPDGTLYTANLRAAKVTDYYTFASDGTITYEPKFTQHGFRYVEITGTSTPPEPSDVTGVVWESDLPVTGGLETSSPMLNQLSSNISWGQRGNFLSIPTDTPARDERLGWSGDINVFAPTASYLRDTRAFLSKWMSDMSDAQFANGDLPGIAPEPPGVGCCGSGTGWSDAGITVPYALYDSYGDASIAREFYPEMTAFMDYLRAHTGPDMIDQGRGHWGDWLHLDDPTPTAVMGTAYLAEDARMMAEMAAALGKDADADEYAQLSEDARAAFADAFIDADGTVSGNSQTAYAMALGMDLVPDDLREAVGERFVAKLAATDNHLTTGFLGTPWLLPALSSIDRDDLAYTMLMHEDYPSWGYEVANGATTMWERWNSIMPDGSFGPVEMNSFNHYAYGAVGDWMYENIGGIAAAEPGYRTSRIAPKPGGGLTHGSGQLETVYGTLASSWEQTEDGVTMDVTVPVNTTAEVHVPADSRWAVTEGGAPADDVAGVTFNRMADGAAVYEVGSGDYAFATDPTLGSLGEARAGAAKLVGAVEELDAPGSKAVRGWTDSIEADTDTAWTTYVDGDNDAAAVAVHRALARLGDVERWTAHQVEKGRLTAAEGDAVQALVDRIRADLSDASGRLLGAAVTVEMPAQEWFPGSTVPVTVVVENSGSSALSELDVALAAGDGWEVTAAPDAATTVEPGETARLEYDVAVPESAAAGNARIDGTVTYRFRGGAASLPVSATIAIAAPVGVESVTPSPSPAAPGDRLTVAVELANRADRTVAGDLELMLPDGWTVPDATPYSLAAGESQTVEVVADVPLALTSGEFTVGASVGATGFERATATGEIAIATPPAGVIDHVDLGDAASEQEHGLTASPMSGTNVEAGLTRRYSHVDAGDGWFEFDVDVPAGERFVVTAIETYDADRPKSYDITIDGETVLERRYDRSPGGVGTLTYQFVVEPSAVTDDGRVRMRFQDVPGEYDPSIADIWVTPIG